MYKKTLILFILITLPVLPQPRTIQYLGSSTPVIPIEQLMTNVMTNVGSTNYLFAGTKPNGHVYKIIPGTNPTVVKDYGAIGFDQGHFDNKGVYTLVADENYIYGATASTTSYPFFFKISKSSDILSPFRVVNDNVAGLSIADAEVVVHSGSTWVYFACQGYNEFKVIRWRPSDNFVEIINPPNKNIESQCFFVEKGFFGNSPALYFGAFWGEDQKIFIYKYLSNSWERKTISSSYSIRNFKADAYFNPLTCNKVWLFPKTVDQNKNGIITKYDLSNDLNNIDIPVTGWERNTADKIYFSQDINYIYTAEGILNKQTNYFQSISGSFPTYNVVLDNSTNPNILYGVYNYGEGQPKQYKVVIDEYLSLDTPINVNISNCTLPLGGDYISALSAQSYDVYGVVYFSSTCFKYNHGTGIETNPLYTGPPDPAAVSSNAMVYDPVRKLRFYGIYNRPHLRIDSADVTLEIINLSQIDYMSQYQGRIIDMKIIDDKLFMSTAPSQDVPVGARLICFDLTKYFGGQGLNNSAKVIAKCPDAQSVGLWMWDIDVYKKQNGNYLIFGQVDQVYPFMITMDWNAPSPQIIPLNYVKWVTSLTVWNNKALFARNNQLWVFNAETISQLNFNIPIVDPNIAMYDSFFTGPTWNGVVKNLIVGNNNKVYGSYDGTLFEFNPAYISQYPYHINRFVVPGYTSTTSKRKIHRLAMDYEFTWNNIVYIGNANGQLLYLNDNTDQDKIKTASILNYPNPFNPTTTIRFNIPEDGLVSVKIYDILGREVLNLLNDYRSSGTYEVVFKAGDMPSGVYFCRINGSNYNVTRKMLLLK